MNKPTPNNRSLLRLVTQHPIAIASVAFVSGLSLLSNNWALAQTDALIDSVSVPATPAPAPAPKAASPAPAPAPAPEPAPAPRAASPAPAPAPAPRAVSPAPEPAPQAEFSAPAKLNAPSVNVPNDEPASSIPERLIDRPAPQAQGVQPQIQILDKGTNNFADNLGGSNSSDSVSVQITDRATGCRTVNGQASGNCGGSGTTASKPNAPKPAVAVTASPIQQRRQLQVQRQAIATSNTRKAVSTQAVGQTRPTSGSKVQAIPAEQLAFYQNARQEDKLPGKTALIFPLSIPANISSAFGWRIHPILGTRRMHAGTDISAPNGTPVLAAYPGQVAIAGNVGGYGLMVTLRHENDRQESRYAHLSEIFVEPGQEVEQGQIIGLVGSTGLSTGPHLHFEWRHLMPSGWVAVDAGMHLEAAMQNLIVAMEQTEVGEVLEPHEELQLTFDLEPRSETVAAQPQEE